MRSVLPRLVATLLVAVTLTLPRAVAAPPAQPETGPTSARAGAPEASRVAPPHVVGRRYVIPTRFPRGSNTGAPPVSRLRPYRGPCEITQDGKVIAYRHVVCDLKIRAAGVVIERSLVHGTIETEGHDGSSFVLRRSTVDASPGGATNLVTVIGASRFRVVRSEVRGGNRSINCEYDCVVRRSWIHGQDVPVDGETHESAVRMGQFTRLVGNTLTCDAPNVPPDGGCSASLTGYGDFEPVRNNLIQGNLFLPSTGGTCVYGGSSGGKPYSDDAANIHFVDNVFRRGRTDRCGRWAPVMDFDRRAPGNVWSGNRWASGGTVRP